MHTAAREDVYTWYLSPGEVFDRVTTALLSYSVRCHPAECEHVLCILGRTWAAEKVNWTNGAMFDDPSQFSVKWSEYSFLSQLIAIVIDRGLPRPFCCNDMVAIWLQ